MGHKQTLPKLAMYEQQLMTWHLSNRSPQNLMLVKNLMLVQLWPYRTQYFKVPIQLGCGSLSGQPAAVVYII
jgi:hypothetical protein